MQGKRFWGWVLSGVFVTSHAASAGSNPSDAKKSASASELREVEANTREALARIVRELEQVDARIVLRGRAYVKTARAGLLPVAGGVEALVDHASGLERMRRALKRDQDLQKRLLERRLALVRELVDVQNRRNAIDDTDAGGMAPHAAILAERDRSLAFEKAFAVAKGAKQSSDKGLYAAPASSSQDAGRDFETRRGRLPLPVSGRARVHASEKHGAEIGARGGAAVRSVHRGRVVFAGPYGDRGKTVILDHGDGYSTLSAGLGEVRVAVGETLPAGTQLGTLAGSGARKLYFEVRHAEAPLPTPAWFGL